MVGPRDCQTQVELAAKRAGLYEIFGDLTFEAGDVAGLQIALESDEIEVRFRTGDGPGGVLFLDLYDSGNPEDDGLTIGLRGWRLDQDVASV